MTLYQQSLRLKIFRQPLAGCTHCGIPTKYGSPHLAFPWNYSDHLRGVVGFWGNIPAKETASIAEGHEQIVTVHSSYG
jgi:hypothetical protein